MPPDGGASLYLTLDQGGHASRALVFDARGAVRARAARPVGVFHPRPDWVEQDPEELVASLADAARDALAALGADAARVAAAGLATQRSSIVCWDRDGGAALSPVLSWQDRRAHEWLAHFLPHAGAVQRATGLRLSPHYGASKLRWCLDHLPAVARAAEQGRLAFGPLASFLVFRLTRERTLAADPANAGRTLLWSLATLDWDEGLLHLFSLPRAALPACVPTRHAFGTVQVAGRDIPLAIVTGDQSAALFARGAPAADAIYVNLGTGAFAQRLVARAGSDARLLAGVVLRDGGETLTVREGTVNGAGSALAWASEALGLPDLEKHLPQWLAQAAEPPLFLNGIGGLGAPWWVADFESRFAGAGDATQKACAVAESIVFLLQANLELLRAPTGVQEPPPAQLIATGGLSALDALCQRLADLSALPLYRPVEHEATARGLAWLLAGKPRDWPEPEPGTRFAPRPNPALAARYARWRAAMDVALAERR